MVCHPYNPKEESTYNLTFLRRFYQVSYASHERLHNMVWRQRNRATAQPRNRLKRQQSHTVTTRSGLSFHPATVMAPRTALSFWPDTVAARPVREDARPTHAGENGLSIHGWVDGLEITTESRKP
jgi:hypothetical protein